MTPPDEAPRPVTAGGSFAAFLAFLKDELRPKPGRMGAALRMAALTVMVVVISETFRIPLPAYSAYIVFFATKEETASTTVTGIILIISASIAILAACGFYTISAGEPGLRLPLMALLTFSGLFMSRVSPLGPAAFVIGFLMTIALTLIDVVSTRGLTPGAEILTQTVLWLWVVVVMPIGLVVVFNLVMGSSPASLFRHSLSARLEAAGQILLDGDRRDSAIDRRMAGIVRSGIGNMLRYLKLSALLDKRSPRQMAANRALVGRTHEILMLVAEWEGVATAEPPLNDVAAACGRIVMAASRAVASGTPLPRDQPWPSLQESHWRANPRAALLLGRLIQIIDNLPILLAERLAADVVSPDRPEQSPAGGRRRQLVVEDAFTNREHVRFALKATLAIMLAYIAYDLLDWPGIRTSMITCFFVTLGNVGETVHKMTLRLVGALIGAGLGLITILFLMPLMTTLTDLCLAVGAVSLLAAWITTSSERLSYVGMQIAMAYFFCTLVGYGPTIDLTEPRDRLVGILFGNLIVGLVFTHIWPVSVVAQAHQAFAGVARKLADLVLPKDPSSGTPPDRTDAAVFAFDTALAETRRLLTFDPFEPRRVKGWVMVDPGDADTAQSLVGPCLILDYCRDNGDVADYRTALNGWLSQLGQAVATRTPKGSLPRPPDALATAARLDRDTGTPIASAEAVWLRELHRRVVELDGLARGKLGAADAPEGETS